ncbi:MAG: glycosyl hydrolase [Verrucomicrobia bacterium]|jgi:unsaturated chondroitin disaccharide hydrolase|nr:glycosyl hydrolase [Verrucomicrobiota bacterium]
MAIKIDLKLTPGKMVPALERMFDLSGKKILNIERTWKPSQGTPVFTVRGKYATRGWTEWTQGFQYGSAVLQYDATNQKPFLKIGRTQTVQRMATHVSHIGVHDHGFNNVSTYGNLLRLMREKRIPQNDSEQDFYELALKVSGAVQASRWTSISGGGGFVHSFNGSHSLFIDTIRSMRALGVGHCLGHVLMAENDQPVSLLQRNIEHAQSTADYGVYYGEGRDAYDVRGRTAHESVFNVKDGNYRCPNSQQGYSPFSTWTRGLAWAICGYAEQLEFLQTLPDKELKPLGGRKRIEAMMLKAAEATSDFYLENSCTDGIPMWDTGAPNIHRLGNYLDQPSNPYNDWEPVDSSAAAIAAQGLIRLGKYLQSKGRKSVGKKYYQAGLTVTASLLEEPYLSTNDKHQGLLLHSIYHRPNDWDYIPRGQKIPCGESSMWGDYHLRELVLLVHRIAKKQPYLTFFGCLG